MEVYHTRDTALLASVSPVLFRLLDKINGTLFDLGVGFGQILPHDTDGEQLDTGKQREDAHEGRIARHRIPPHSRFDDDNDDQSVQTRPIVFTRR